mmetsp:Transcript_26020/g.77696  ORF Transcript_26020/g.77696 Transcript_26020/m.77696 type:complete len:272 (-) Transcript_26020:2117-2932(-)
MSVSPTIASRACASPTYSRSGRCMTAMGCTASASACSCQRRWRSAERAAMVLLTADWTSWRSSWTSCQRRCRSRRDPSGCAMLVMGRARQRLLQIRVSAGIGSRPPWKRHWPSHSAHSEAKPIMTTITLTTSARVRKQTASRSTRRSRPWRGSSASSLQGRRRGSPCLCTSPICSTWRFSCPRRMEDCHWCTATMRRRASLDTRCRRCSAAAAAFSKGRTPRMRPSVGLVRPSARPNPPQSSSQTIARTAANSGTPSSCSPCMTAVGRAAT